MQPLPAQLSYGVLSRLLGCTRRNAIRVTQELVSRGAAHVQEGGWSVDPARLRALRAPGSEPGAFTWREDEPG